MFCFNYNHSYVKNYENDKYSNFKQLAEGTYLQGPWETWAHPVSLEGVREKRLHLCFQIYLRGKRLFYGYLWANHHKSNILFSVYKGWS